LCNGIIASNEERPVRILDEVRAEGFMLSPGVSLSSAAVISNCYIGEDLEITSTELHNGFILDLTDMLDFNGSSRNGRYGKSV
ncbi:MAG: hypothetical protein JNL74_17090, partial [Fibrobacteres bacterium]|nr:hypothetical protein [Fibrobacterota bacterium]